jgi:hypothetical protein
MFREFEGNSNGCKKDWDESGKTRTNSARICKIVLCAKNWLRGGLERGAVQHVVRPFYVVRSSRAALTSAARRHAA